MSCFFNIKRINILYFYKIKNIYALITLSSFNFLTKYRGDILGHPLYRVLYITYLFIASSIATATATVAPTIGLLPIPISPIISTCAGTDEEPAN